MKDRYAFLIPLLFIYACSSSSASKQAGNPLKAYPVSQVLQKDTSFHVQYVADIQARKNIEILARVSGILEHIYVDEGDAVRKGQLLFTINDDELQIALSKTNAALNNAKADARVAEVELQRVQRLVDKKIVAKSELELAEARLNAFRAKIEEARSEKEAVQKRISYTRITSPFDGVIDRLPLKEGSYLSEHSSLTTISDIRSVLAYFNVSENEYLRLARENKEGLPHAEVRLLLADGSLYPIKGKIEANGSEIDDNTGSIAFRADFPNPDKVLKHGASGTVLISSPAASVLMVPQQSVLEIQDKNYVYVLDKENKVRMKSFQPAGRIGDYYIIESGLSPQDKIVLEGIQTISNGEQIRPVAASHS
ncbi:efflux RND transporter periplasmic adaptor subunit [Taibaiella helva]|uniref:efflux RND transporter periplasmic adaptor subunit n=1 Tax=Taibaiella helva TaxID=2301235 RepID=UPI000E578F0F|nr:efflux RND transporter periplasmic adaptor subunit [Taibaiella helva]